MTDLDVVELDVVPAALSQSSRVSRHRLCRGGFALLRCPFGPVGLVAETSRDRGGARRLTLNGGAITDLADEDSAFSHRDALVESTTGVGSTDRRRTATASLPPAAGLEPFASGLYVNTIADEDDSMLRQVYSLDELTRLRDLKRRYDPPNVFHRTTNIRP